MEQMEQVSTQSVQLPPYEEPEMKTYSEADLKERFSDILSSTAFFHDSHGSPGE
jgi:hypothetical protein